MEPYGSFVYVVKQLELGLRPRFFEACAAAGMTAAQYTALTVLQRRPGITSSELARRSFVRAQTMAATVDPLVEAGHVRRERDPEHGRRILLYLTESGSNAISTLNPQIDALEELLVSELSAKERAQFADYLRRCRHALGQAGHRVPTRSS
ncbi:MarR family winged helix-turn-helix transcriptional regulator [Leifsonia sp. Root112D2]|jgi:DNA-binding MarR family transcriptional regulator|uniref:MarR family winged helix-turn-helix transcriptional regulator n=1 Tax=Leifsonia sp. Root112D2 TaxID=1736426 RepID=UPI0006F6E799|nr:MarR family transcriptional regulator [Leifsonia sp. Root112D2]KQV06086.1 hypothetical protein ASC63_00880 [Leifsonia sp. Root112D2]